MSGNKDEKKPNEQKQAKKDKQKQNQKDAEVLKLLQEDEDDFQQFEEDAYDDRPPQKIDAKQWRQDWDDEDINDDFASQLRKELKN